MWAAVVQLILTVTQPLVSIQHGPKDSEACGVSTTLVDGLRAGEGKGVG
jgi:hypothetical protein